MCAFWSSLTILFIFQFSVTINGRSCQGAGPNKKLAKRACAEAMLDLLGYNKPMPKPGKSLLKKKSTVDCFLNCGDSSNDASNENNTTISPEATTNATMYDEFYKYFHEFIYFRWKTTSTDEAETATAAVDDGDQTTPKRRVTFSNEVTETALPGSSTYAIICRIYITKM